MSYSRFTCTLLALMCLVFPHVAPGGVKAVEGVVGPGALYALYAPDGSDGDVWNGDVVYYAHGYVFPNAPIALPSVEALRDALVEAGYGFAYSSYSANGFAVKEGVQRTHQLRGLFKSEIGLPRRSYLAGESMGGLVVIALAEKYPQQYSGVLPMCGGVGGSLMLWDAVLQARAVFDYYYPGALPGNALNVPEGTNFGSQIAPSVIGSVVSDPASATALANVEQLHITYDGVGELTNTLLIRFFVHTIGMEEALGRTHGRSFFDNRGIAYTGSPDDNGLNAGVERFESTPDAVNYMQQNYEPNGGIQIPVLALHTTRDPLVPIEHVNVYEQKVMNAGAGGLFARQDIERFGHCAFTTEEMTIAVQDLATWVETGVRPGQP